MSTNEFMSGRVDVARFGSYQRKVLPPDFFSKKLPSLVKLCAEPAFPVVEFLLHPELGTCNKDVLLDYVLGRDPERPDGQRRLRTVFEWALTYLHNARIPRGLRRGQVNRNAATLLSSGWAKLWDAMNKLRKDRTDKYPFDLVVCFVRGALALDRMFAGHFERIFVAWLGHSAGAYDWMGNSEKWGIINFAVAHVDVQAYVELVCHLFAEFRDIFGSDSHFVGFVKYLLQQAAWETFVINDCFVKDPELRSDPLVERARLIWRQEPAQLNLDYEPIPPPQYAGKQTIALGLPPGYQGRLDERKRRMNFRPSSRSGIERIRLAQQAAYSLLTIVASEPSIVPRINQDLGCLKFLLICGIYADATSGVSKVAFRLLKALIYRDNMFFDTNVRRLVDEFACDFVFDERLTPQMVAAFPIFWNHLYPELDDAVAYATVDVTMLGKGTPNEVYRIVRPKGLTPLEKFGRYLLDEPALSDALNREIMFVLEFLANYAHEVRVRRGVRDYMEYQRRVMNIDQIFFEFFRTRIEYGGIFGDMALATKAVPLAPFDDFFRTGRTPAGRSLRRPRAAVNGGPLWFVKFWMESDIFQLDDGESGMAGLAPALDTRAAMTVLRLQKPIDDLAPWHDPLPTGNC
jgi:hypothetical protein